ncbi:MAG: right-handed parallel beta-helix repeat-containing protein, partial [Candidatus Hydrogenedentes bacterium]|nr:right-handed parallel beta-helix repeat-containing protein [Candidatus Hydrogenedentota bacterium]
PMRNSTLLARGALEFPLINGHHRIGGVDLPAPLPVTLGPGESAELPLRLPAAAVEGFESVLAAAIILEAEGTLEAAFNGAAPGDGGSLPADAIRAGENTLQLRNTGNAPATLNRAALALTLPPVAPTVFPELPPEQCIHISEKGSDENPGTLEQPVKTLGRAGDIRKERELGVEHDVCYWLHEGTYRSEKIYGMLDTAEAMHNPDYYGNRTYYVRAWPGEKPVISNGEKITGWQPHAQGIWKTPRLKYSPRSDIYVNGVRAKRARGKFPEGWRLWGDTKHIDGIAGYHIPGMAMAEWSKPEDLQVGYFNSWAHMVCLVNRVIPDGDGGAYIIMKQPSFFLGLHKEGVQATTPAYLENAIELLDEPGEYYVDWEKQVVYYYPRDGEDLETAWATFGDWRSGVGIPGNTWIEGVIFADVGPDLSPNRMDTQANFAIGMSIFRNLFERDGFLVNLHNEYERNIGGVTVSHSHNVRFIGCTFTRFDGPALNIPNARGLVVDGCTFDDIGGTAIQIGDVSQFSHHPFSINWTTRDNVVANCVIRNCGVLQEGSVGIFVGYANGTVIANNEIYNLPYSGISVGWGWGEEDAGGGNYPIPFKYATPTPSGANRIENNHIYNVMQKRDDGGGVYTLGNQPGTVILGNHIHDNGPGGPGGIYLDEGSGYIEVTGNRVYDVVKPMNYNNHAQDRISTCFEHGNSWNE